jgi:prefoldin subunit 5
MKDIHEVLRQKQAKYAQLGKQIEMLQQAAEKLREVAPLLAENDDDDNGVLAEVDESSLLEGDAMSAKAGAGSGGSAPSKAPRPAAPRWP